MLAQYNILKFYDSIEARQWNNPDTEPSRELYRIFLATGVIPAIQVIVATSSGATIQLLNSNDEAVGSPLMMTVENATTYKRLIYLGTTLTGQTDGDYSLKITNGSDVYYSDVFGWTSDSENFKKLLKISAVSGDFTMGRNYSFNLTNFTFECYVNAEYLGIAPEFEDVISQRNGVGLPIHGNLVPTREWNVYACEYIYRFLLGLRILETNGTVTVTWKGVSYTASDIMAEKTEDHHELMQVKLSFVEINEVMSVDNEI